MSFIFIAQAPRGFRYFNMLLFLRLFGLVVIIKKKTVKK